MTNNRIAVQILSDLNPGQEKYFSIVNPQARTLPAEPDAANPHVRFVVAERGNLEPEITAIESPMVGPTKKCFKAPRFDPTRIP